MSIIYTQWKCEKCGKEFDTYVSFGHPDKDFVYKWQCGECNYVNELLVKAMPKLFEESKTSWLQDWFRTSKKYWFLKFYYRIKLKIQLLKMKFFP